MKQIIILFIISLIFIVTATDAFAKPKTSIKEHEADKQVIASYILSLNRELRTDSLTSERDGFEEGTVAYSPDKKFNIFVIKGEECGGHCECIYQAFLHFTTSKIRRNLTSDFLPVDTIFKLTDNKYLVIQKASTCGGTVFYNYKRATLLSFKNGKIIYQPFKYHDRRDGTNNNIKKGDRSLSLYQYMDDKHNLILQFDPKTKRLNYKYIIDFEDKNEAYTFSGYFHYEKGLFVHKSETKSRLIR